MLGLGMTLKALIAAVILLCGTALSAHAASADFSNWMVLVVSGDYKGHQNEHIEAFDNARRDVRKTLEGMGFSRDYIAEFAAGPDATEERPQATRAAIDKKLVELRSKATAGCLFYFTSHGSPKGMVLGEEAMTPLVLWKLVTFNCEQRPAIVIVSACYSGIFVTRDIATANRMVLTAASNQTTSFGCGANNKYPFFDQCFLESVSLVRDFIALAEKTRGCVSALEVQQRLSPPSRPQLVVGKQIEPLLKQMRFDPLTPQAAAPGARGPSGW
jgi:hypothetical protein